jgi:hypothetical protein
MDVRIRDGWRPLYITEAEGHEPLYHHFHAITISLFGENIVGYKWLPMAFGVLSVALTYALARRLFGLKVALAASTLIAVSFWPIMYARFGLRHVGVLPWMLGGYWAVVGGVSRFDRKIGARRRLRQSLVGGVCLAAGLMTYFAGRVAPAVVAAFAVYLLLLHRSKFRRAWLSILIVLIVGAALALPMFLEINRLLPGGEQRLEVVGPQLAELRKGNLLPTLETTIGTLGMFTIRGDPEMLYNLEGRPVFDGLTGACFYLGLAVAVWRWRRIAYGFILIAFGLGIAPAFISNPPASFSHTLAAMPLTYLLAALGIGEAVQWIGKRRTSKQVAGIPVYGILVCLFIFSLNGFFTLRDYFGAWAGESYVRFLYHAPIREIAQWLDETPEVNDLAVSTHPNYFRLDPLALSLDLKRNDVRARWFDSSSALVEPANDGLIVGTSLNLAGEQVNDWAACCAVKWSFVRQGDGYMVWKPTQNLLDNPVLGLFGKQLSLVGVDLDPYHGRQSQSAPDSLWLALTWQVENAKLPQAYNIFVHLIDGDGNMVSQYDGMGVYLPSLHDADRFVQYVNLERPVDLAKKYSLRIGLYATSTSERLSLPDGRDSITLDIP